MKTNELNNGIKEVYAKPSIEVEEMEVQWGFLACGGCTDDTSGEGDNSGSSATQEGNLDPEVYGLDCL